MLLGYYYQMKVLKTPFYCSALSWYCQVTEMCEDKKDVVGASPVRVEPNLGRLSST